MQPVVIALGELAEQMRKDVDTLRAWAAREDDPLPVRYGGARYGFLLVSEFEEWAKRNCALRLSRKGEKDG